MMKKNLCLKAVGLVCAMTMLSASLAACGGGEPASGTQQPASQATESQSGTAAAEAQGEDQTAQDEVYEVDILSITYTGEPIAEDAATKLAFEAYTNSKINFTWVADSNYEDKLNVMMASNALPTIVTIKSGANFTASIINNARAGAFWDITDELGNYENLKKTNDIVLSNISIDGRIYGVPRSRVLGRNGIAFRKDWLENLGLSEPKTIDDIYNTLKAFTYDDPDQNGADDTYGMTWSKWHGPLDIIATWFGAGNQWVEQADGSVEPFFTSAEYMDSMLFAKKLYDEGLINEDFAVRDSAIWADDFNAGRSGVHIDVADQATRFQSELDKINLPDTVWAIGSVEGPKGLYNLPTTGHAGMLSISKNGAKTEEDMRKALAFIDKSNDTECMDLFTYGVKDKDFTINDDGLVVRTEEAVARLQKENEGFNQFMTDVLNNATPELMSPIRAQVTYVQREFNPPICVANPCQSLIASSSVYTEKGSQLDKLWQDARIQFIVGQIDEAGYQAAIGNWRAQGGDALIAELSQMNQANK